MNALVIYDSKFGNTEKVAQTIAKSLKTKALHINKANVEDFKDLDLLVVGTPTHGGRPTPEMKAFLKKISSDGLSGVKVAAFDTRASKEEIENGNFLLKLFVKLVGYAAKPLGKSLEKKGGELITEPVGFEVNGKEGPLLEGELEKAEELVNHLQ